MNILLVFLFFHLQSSSQRIAVDPAKSLFESSAKKLGIDISTDGANMFNTFKDNLKIIKAFNDNPDNTYKLGITPFAFMTDAQRAKFLGLTLEQGDPTFAANNEQAI